MNAFIKGGLILGLSALVCKVLGAIYRIPLTNILGAEGMGIYQTVFPFYIILLTLSSSGIPSAVAKLVAEGKNPKKVVYRSIIVFGTLGFIGSILMALLSKSIAKGQGEEDAWLSYIALSPSVFFVSIISVLRGYHQGLNNMKATAISQVIEQAVKLALGLFLVSFFASSPKAGAALAALSVTFSEIFALLFIILYGKRGAALPNGEYEDITYKELLKTVAPIALTSLMLPLCRAADSFLVVNILKSYETAAISLYGIYAGSVESLVGVPVALCYGLAVSGLPRISRDKSGKTGGKVIRYTALLSVFFGICTFIFSEFIIRILYGGLSDNLKTTAINLLKISSASVFLLPVLQASSTVLVGKGRAKKSALNLFFGLIVKVVIVCFSVKIPKVNIYGAAFSDIGCYFVATFLNLLYIIKGEKSKEVRRTVILRKIGRRI